MCVLVHDRNSTKKRVSTTQQWSAAPNKAFPERAYASRTRLEWFLVSADLWARKNTCLPRENQFPRRKSGLAAERKHRGPSATVSHRQGVPPTRSDGRENPCCKKIKCENRAKSVNLTKIATARRLRHSTSPNQRRSSRRNIPRRGRVRRRPALTKIKSVKMRK
ncbi:hypothetical protein PLICRDRAFT_568908 [Plicaturopsis crispa FD-325 SS-3]|nr:hypothetical protein PLICRDRAFT_568908 [Plicaturopsis crispa FD-325 SS-3]